ncbi:Exopolyphosphatase [Bifidobacterium minimum]|uniref:Exopolyphosphatase n=1 Tax=Bifidobacterium minimum TaxID=1693 RepID=A0A087BJZ2_9BIFI|nr:Exopolyphosphatase [Bifidobacterium minimum]
MTKKWLPDEVSTPGQLRKVHDKVREALLPRIESFPASTVPDLVAGTSKTLRSLARLTDSAANKEGPGRAMILDRAALEDWIPRIAAIAPDQRTLLPGITPERTLQIVGGAIVADEVMKAFDVDRLQICPWALREGAILRWLDTNGRVGR